MEPGTESSRGSALRALHAADEQVAALRSGILDGAGRRRALLEISDAVENALRRRLRDAESIPLPIRLKALAPDEMRADEVLAELRQHDFLSIDFAASVHALFEIRRRLGAGSAPEPEDERQALRVVERLEMELQTTPPPFRPSADAAALDDTLVHPVPPPEPRARAPWAVAAAAVALATLLGLGVYWLVGSREDPRLAQGIALFRSGAYPDAAAHFWRYAEANPDDPTPHLYLARIHRRMGRPDLAVPELRTALRLAPDDPDAHAELGFLLLDGGRPAQAIERFREALRLDPETAEAWIGLVRALRASGRDGSADRVLARAPERVRELFARQP